MVTAVQAQTGPVTSTEIESPPNGYRGFRSGADLRTEYQNLKDGSYRYSVTPRLNYALTPDLALRLEASYIAYSPGDGAPSTSGLGDVLMRAAWRAIKRDGFAVVVAGDLITDTKNDARLGSGRTVVAPSTYAAIDIPRYDSVFFPSIQHYILLYRREGDQNVSYTVLRPGVLTHWTNQVYSFLDPRFVVDWERNAKVGLTVELKLGRHLDSDLPYGCGQALACSTAMSCRLSTNGISRSG